MLERSRGELIIACARQHHVITKYNVDQINFDPNMIKKGKETQLQRFPMDLFLADVNVYMRCHKSALTHAVSLSGDYGLFTHSDVSYGL